MLDRHAGGFMLGHKEAYGRLACTAHHWQHPAGPRQHSRPFVAQLDRIWVILVRRVECALVLRYSVKETDQAGWVRRVPSLSARSGWYPLWPRSVSTPGHGNCAGKFSPSPALYGPYAEELDPTSGRHLGNFPKPSRAKP
jgi:hypothetical protein